MDFSKVKKIKIKEGIVTKIRHIASDTILWMAKLIALVTGKFPLTLEKSTGEELVDYKVYGESVQPTELYNPDLWQDGFINSSGSADPYTSSSYPDAKYFKIALKQGQVVQFTVEPNNTKNSRIRYIDPTTNTLKGNVGTDNAYVTSTDNQSTGFRSATITATKDVTLAFMDIKGTINTYTTFSLIADVSSSNPVEVESVGDRTANLIDVYDNAVKSRDALTGTKNGITWSKNKDGSVTLNGTATSQVDVSFEGAGSYSTLYTVNRPAGDYTIRKLFYTGTTSNESGVRLYCVWYNSSGTQLTSTPNVHLLSANNLTFTIPETATYARTFVRVTTAGITCTNLTVYPMVYEGSVGTDYEPYGYKVPVKVNEETINIYLNEPLRKIGDYADYVDFENKKVVRNVEVVDDTGTKIIEESLRGLETPIEESIDLPAILTQKGTNIISIDTKIQPSNGEIKYWKE